VLDVDDWEQAWNAVNRYHPLLARFLSWQEEWGIRHAVGVTCASRWLEAKMGTVASHIPTFYLPNGVEALHEPPLPTLHTDTPKVLFFTRMVEVAPSWLCECWRTLLTRWPNAELIMAGAAVQPWLAAPFRAALDPLPNVRWTGYVGRAALRRLYAEATCAIFPAALIPLHQAKCSVRLATTLLHGVPVVASAVGEQANYGAEGAAELVPADASPIDFARAVAQMLERIMNHPEQQAAMRHAASARLLTRYAWSHLTDTLPAFYADLGA
jgi:glycosyltransferase involved in cell wall biosynthesis